jgi:CHAT domain-containing protein
MVSPHTNGCPEPEVLAAYVDRGLSLSERARVDAHLASCPQCIALVAGVARTVEELSVLRPNVAVTAEAPPLITRRSVAGVLAAAAAVIAVLATPALVRPWLERDPGLVSLVESVGEQRSVLGRLTGGFPHAPLGAPSAGGQDGRPAGTDRVQLAAGRIRESFGERKTPSQLHAIGVSQLLAGQYDDAALSLLAASREQPANAQYLSDVAAVQIERARLGLRPDDLPRALAAADRARRLDPSLKEAWFNRALAASALSLTAEAKSAWTEYLKRDSTSPWAGEAKKRLDELSSPSRAAAWTVMEGRLQSAFDASTADEAVRTQTTEARNFIENGLIVSWANAVLAGNSGDDELDRVRVMAAAMQRVAGDSLYADAVAAIDRSAVRGRSAVTDLAQIHRDYATAAAAFADDLFATSGSLLSNVRSRFASAGSPFAHRATLDLGAVAYFTGRSSEVERSQVDLLHVARVAHYSNIATRIAWQQGLAAFAQGRLAETQARYEETLAGFAAMGDAEGVANAHNLLAALFDYLGDASSAWQHRTAAFEGLSISRSPRFKYSLLAAAVPSIRVDSPETALSVQDAAVTAAEQWGLDAAVADAKAQRASLLNSLGRYEDADRAINDAKQSLKRVPDPVRRSRIEVAVLSAESDLYRRRSPEAAVAAATRAISIVEQRHDRLRIAQLNLRLAKANLALGRTAEARLALDRGLAAFNEERAASTEIRPISALDESWQLLDASMQLSLQQKDYKRAFALSEAARMRSASEAKKFGEPDLNALQQALQPDEAILALNQFDDQLAVWVIRRDAVNVTTRAISRQSAQQLIARQQDEISQAAITTTAGRELYNEIVRPVRSQLTGATRLIFIPDMTFQDAAFAAFYNPTSGRFILEDVTVRMSPSGAAFAASVSGDRGNIVEPLIFDGSRNSDATAITAVYGKSQRRSGAEATRERLFNDAANRRIVHLSAQTSSNQSYPFLSQIVVSDEPGVPHSGMILGSDIAQRVLPHTGVVVLDDSSAAPSHRGEGTSSVARAFMTAGVSAVVGSLPGADEAATRDLLIGFHREMSKGVSAEQALSQVQRNAIKQNGRRLGAWTALVIYGSDR